MEKLDKKNYEVQTAYFDGIGMCGCFSVRPAHSSLRFNHNNSHLFTACTIVMQLR